MSKIYGLVDPVTNEIRYVGKTDNLTKRLRHHLQDPANNHRTHWLRKLLILGLHPKVIVLAEVDKSNWIAAEREWIAKLKTSGANLVNGTDGGEGSPGRKMLEETKQKIGDANRGRAISEETRAKMSKSAHGRKMSDDTKRKMSEALMGHETSDETRKKIGHANKGSSDRMRRWWAKRKQTNEQ